MSDSELEAFRKEHEYVDYDADPPEFVPCTCLDSCQPGCHGQCGCEAHRLAYGDFLSLE